MRPLFQAGYRIALAGTVYRFAGFDNVDDGDGGDGCDGDDDDDDDDDDDGYKTLPEACFFCR